MDACFPIKMKTKSNSGRFTGGGGAIVFGGI